MGVIEVVTPLFKLCARRESCRLMTTDDPSSVDVIRIEKISFEKLEITVITSSGKQSIPLANIRGVQR